MDIIVATNNKGKLAEFNRILLPLGIHTMSLADLGVCVEIEETGTTFLENAKIKAESIYKITGKPTIADDSGLCVDYLNDAPGVYSARYAGESASDEQNIQKLLQALTLVPMEKRAAKFICSLYFIIDDSRAIAIEESCNGYIGTKKIGEKGFGYDPIFMVENQSFAQIMDKEKDEISHRGKALRQLRNKITELYREELLCLQAKNEQN